MKSLLLALLIMIGSINCYCQESSDKIPIAFDGKTYGYMIRVPGGTFTMGSNDGDSDEKPPHSVSVSTFYIGETEVTQELWKDVMDGDNPSSFKNKGVSNPVESITWYDAVMFCNKLSEKNNKPKVYSISNIKYDSNHKHIIDANVTPDFTKKGYRLPTEAEWEFAARGGKSGGTKYSGSDSIDDVAVYDKNSYDLGSNNSAYGTHQVKSKKPNSLGIYDMSGNVWEWCNDWKGSYNSGSQTNPQGPSSGSCRVLRGGSWSGGANGCRVAIRDGHSPDFRFYYYGLRLALVP